MAITPIIGMINERLILPKIGTKECIDRPMDTHHKKSQKIILVGFGSFGSTIGRFLRSHDVEATILDHDSNRVDFLRKIGFEVYYGDATRIDLLESAGMADAKILICAIDNPDATKQITRLVKEKYPLVELMIRARNRYDAYDLVNLGMENIYRETLETSLTMASDVLAKVGFQKETLKTQVQNFITYDDENLRRLAGEPNRDDNYIFKARQKLGQQEKFLNEALKRDHLHSELLKNN